MGVCLSIRGTEGLRADVFGGVCGQHRSGVTVHGDVGKSG